MASVNARRSLSNLLSRALSSSSSFPSHSRLTVALLNKTPVFIPEATKILTRTKTSASGYSPLNDPSPNWSNRPPKETILLDGCDYEHWLIVLEFPEDPKPSEEEMIDAYVKTLASVVGSEEEAKKRIYSVCTTRYTGFGALISEELSYKVKGLPRVLWVLPDSYLDVPNKDYGGDLFVDGKVIHRPQYTSSVQPSSGSRVRGRVLLLLTSSASMLVEILYGLSTPPITFAKVRYSSSASLNLRSRPQINSNPSMTKEQNPVFNFILFIYCTIKARLATQLIVTHQLAPNEAIPGYLDPLPRWVTFSERAGPRRVLEQNFGGPSTKKEHFDSFG
ncbi:hypothetical protein GOBAR_AA03769 [Gossypium barbadense]|uniref:MORF/ORRM1/DAG-like MORF domain-containing protein n=1 Tax=Gossypium barbadense TaxID=3634 RepID=A0A2P5YME0_GOSBA|nr:hypothetical protein GOBAR_AA03769 [Gossypium barbadense]